MNFVSFVQHMAVSQREMESSWEEHNGKSGAQKSPDWLGSFLSKLPALLIYISVVPRKHTDLAGFSTILLNFQVPNGFFGKTVHLTIQKLKSKHLVFSGDRFFLRGREKILYPKSGDLKDNMKTQQTPLNYYLWGQYWMAPDFFITFPITLYYITFPAACVSHCI